MLTSEMSDKLRERLLAFGHDAADEDDARLTLFCERAEAYILQTCGLDELPEELDDICLDLAAVDLLAARLAAPSEDSEDMGGETGLSSLRMGDVSLSYGDGGSGSTASTAQWLADMLARINAVIAGFRGVQW